MIRLGKTTVPAGAIKRQYTHHLDRLREWLAEQRYIDVLYVRYDDVMQRPGEQAEPITPRRIEIELNDGCRIRVEEGVGLASLRRVLTALRE